jgi:glycosyltransferase involved in cell wall biosynthesis
MINSPHKSKKKIAKVIYISTYIPQKCGIATYTKDTTHAINLLNSHALAEIITIVKEKEENLCFPLEVKFKIKRNDLNSYLQATNHINNSDCDIAMIEHEFGIFGGNFGNYAIDFIKAIKKPVIITCHTIPENPNTGYGLVLKKMGVIVSGITVMTKNSRQSLIENYTIDQKKIIVIPHGTPDIPLISTEYYKKQKNLSNRLILGSINLISKNKGLEYTIQAVAKIAKTNPEVLCLIIGQTHPGILSIDGEKYRNFLKAKVKKYGISKNIKFINKYVSLENLIIWLKTIDFYVTPYLDPQQSCSGALAYAIGAGKICISTPYSYAKESLAEKRGILVPFKNSKSIAKAVLKIWNNPVKKQEMQKNAYKYGRFMTWPSVALQHLNLFEIVKKNIKNHVSNNR